MDERDKRLRKRLLDAVREDIRRRDIDRAIRRFVQLSGMEPLNPSYHLKRGELELRRGRHAAAADAFVMAARLFAKAAFDDKAISLYKRAIECGPGRFDIVSALAVAYARAGRIGEANGLLSSHADEAFRSGNLGESVDLLRALVGLDPSARVRLRLADLLERSERYEEALSEYAEGAISLAEQNDPDAVLRAFDRIVDLTEKGAVAEDGVLGRLFHQVARAYPLLEGPE